MSYKRWTQKEIDYVMANEATMTCKEISKIIGRSPESIMQFVRRNNIPKTRLSMFTDYEIEVMRYWAKSNGTWKGIPLERTNNSVKAKASALGIKLEGDKKRDERCDRYSNMEDNILKECRKRGIKYKKIAKEYLPWRTSNALARRAESLGITGESKIKKKEYFIQTGLLGLVFEMPPTYDNEYHSGSGTPTVSMYGHTIYEA